MMIFLLSNGGSEEMRVGVCKQVEKKKPSYENDLEHHLQYRCLTHWPSHDDVSVQHQNVYQKPQSDLAGQDLGQTLNPDPRCSLTKVPCPVTSRLLT